MFRVTLIVAALFISGCSSDIPMPRQPDANGKKVLINQSPPPIIGIGGVE